MSPSTGVMHRKPESNSAPGPAHSMAGVVKNSLSSGAFQYEALSSSSASSVGVNSSKSRLDDHVVECGCGPFLGLRAKQLGAGNRSSKPSGLKAGVNSSKSRLDDHVVHCGCGPFLGLRARQLGNRNRSSKASRMIAGTVNSSKARLDDHDVQCNSCVPSVRLRTKQLGSRNPSQASGPTGGIDETGDESFIFRLLASCERLRESIKETNVNVYDLFVGNQMMFLMTASPIVPRAKTPSPRCSSRRLAIVPVTSISTSSSTTMVQNINNAGAESSKSLCRTRGSDSIADRRVHSFRR